jgi:hypothetical protein
MPHNDIANLVTVTKMNMTAEMPCGYGTLTTTAVRIWHKVSHRPVQRSQLLQKLSILQGESWIHLHNGRWFQKYLTIHVRSRRAIFLAPGEPVSIWKYFEVLVQLSGVSVTCVSGFPTDCQFADIVYGCIRPANRICTLQSSLHSRKHAMHWTIIVIVLLPAFWRLSN